MNEERIHADDPRLTAFALGELSGEEAAAVAAAVTCDPALAAEVEAIRAMVGGLESALGSEALPEVEVDEPGERIEFPMGRRVSKRFPYYWVSGLAAAGFAVLVMVQSPESPVVGHESGALVEAFTVNETRHEPLMETSPGPDTAAAYSTESVVKFEMENRRAVAESAKASSQLNGSIDVKMPAMAAPMPSSRMRFAVSAELDSAAGEDYARITEPGWQQVANHPLSTFAVDVDSASYANVRRFIRGGSLPPVDAVKVEELVNAFTYDYPGARDDALLAASLEVASAPWAPDHRLVRIGLKAKDIPTVERERANLVFLLDASGSMQSPRKLPLVKEALRLLLGQLREDDRVAIVSYAGSSGLALPSTPVRHRREIERAMAALIPAGSTNGAMGIHLAYDVAQANFVPGGVNRVILCTDGDFNVGTAGLAELSDLIAGKAESGVFLTALGFGTGNYQDETLELLANRGNGQHGYIDSVREARRLLVEQVEGTLNTVARDVKIQVEFNPQHVLAYRLIGYDQRRLAPADFNNDHLDAGEIGAGHTVTALYEVIPTGGEGPAVIPAIDALRYRKPAAGEQVAADASLSTEMLTVQVRAQPPEGGESRRWDYPLVDEGRTFASASADFKFAAAVAGFGLVLRESPAVEGTSLTQVAAWARTGVAADPGGYRREFLDLVRAADELRPQ